MTIFSARIGNYRHRIAIQEKVKGQDANSGEETWIWQDVPGLSSVQSTFLTGGGREFDAADVKQAEGIARVNFRFIPGITQQNRIVHDGVAYAITSIDYDATGRREIRLLCTTGLTDGS